MGWFWTSREIFKDHSNLTATNQRFIYPGSSPGRRRMGRFLVFDYPAQGMIQALFRFMIMGTILLRLSPEYLDPQNIELHSIRGWGTHWKYYT